MEIKGKLEKDAVAITTCKKGESLLEFSIAVINGIGAAPNEKGLRVTCSFYCSMRYMFYFKKGVVVKLQGTLGVRGGTIADGKIMAKLTFRVQHVKLFTNPDKILFGPIDIPGGILPAPTPPLYANN